MGFSSKLAESARNLKKDIENGMDVKTALINFANSVEKAADETSAALKKLNDDLGKK